MTFRILSVLTSILFLLSGCNDSCDRFEITHQGTVVDDTDNPIANVKVGVATEVDIEKDRVGFLAETNAEGFFKDVWERRSPLGQTYLVFEKEGYQTQQTATQSVGISCKDETFNFSVILKTLNN